MAEFVHIYAGVSLPDNAEIDAFVVLGKPPRGANPGELPLTFGPGVIVTNARYPLGLGVKDKLAGVHIKRGAIIGAGAVLLPGVTIGERALVGAGAVITRDVAPGEVVVGNPQRVINQIEQIDDYQ